MRIGRFSRLSGKRRVEMGRRDSRKLPRRRARPRRAKVRPAPRDGRGGGRDGGQRLDGAEAAHVDVQAGARGRQADTGAAVSGYDYLALLSAWLYERGRLTNGACRVFGDEESRRQRGFHRGGPRRAEGAAKGQGVEELLGHVRRPLQGNKKQNGFTREEAREERGATEFQDFVYITRITTLDGVIGAGVVYFKVGFQRHASCSYTT